VTIKEFFKELRAKLKNKERVNKVHLPKELFDKVVKKMNQKTFPASKKKLLVNITFYSSDKEEVKFFIKNV